LDDLADADGEGVEGELGPRGKWPGGKGALAVLGLGEVVVGLLGAGTREVGLGGLGRRWGL
jgi:hypothetical protein